MSFGGQNSQQKSNDSAIGGLNNQLSDIASTAGGRSNKAFKFFKQSAKPAVDYYKTLLSGDKNAVTELLSPELTQIGTIFGNVKHNIGEFGPRGGGSNSAVNNLESQQAITTSNLFTGVRPQAAQQLGSLSGTFGNVASNFGGQQMDAIKGEAANMFGLNAEQEAAQKRKAEAWTGIGGGIGTVAGGIFGGK